MANQTIRHQGIVESINGQHLRVRIVQTSACAACSVKAHCNSADTKEKLIDIIAPLTTPNTAPPTSRFSNAEDSSMGGTYFTNEGGFKVGDSVWVVGELSMGAWAVLLAFVVPFLILLISLFIFMAVWHDELGSALGSLALLIPYYYILHLNKARLGKKFSFRIENDHMPI